MAISDAERKLFQVLYNYFQRCHHMPNWAVLIRSMSGRSKEELKILIRSLVDASYLKWDNEDPATIIIFKRPKEKNPKIYDAERYFNAHYFFIYLYVY